MHILIVSSWYPDNEEDVTACFIREQALALRRYGGHKVSVVYPKFASGNRYNNLFGISTRVDLEHEVEVGVYRSFLPNWLRRVPYLSAEILVRSGMRIFSRYVKENGVPDVVHAHVVNYAGLLAYRISKKYCIPFVVTEHNSGYARGLVKPWQLALGRKAVSGSMACIAVGECFAAELDQVYQVPEVRWRYIPNMVSSKFFELEADTEYKPSKSEFVICTICNLNRNKGVDVLIRAFANSFSSQKSVRLVIGGDGPVRTELEALSESLSLDNQVSFLGKLSRSEVVGIMTKMNVYVLTSQYETFGMVLVEALALGKPVIATRCGGPQSIVTEKNGILIDHSVAATSAAMESIFSSIENYDANEIKKDCQKRFGEHSVVKRLNNVYAEVIGKDNDPIREI